MTTQNGILWTDGCGCYQTADGVLHRICDTHIEAAVEEWQAEESRREWDKGLLEKEGSVQKEEGKWLT